MRKGGSESARIIVEAHADHADVEEKENNVQDEEYTAEGVQAVEPEWDWLCQYLVTLDC
jgi:hypothetical protein